MSQVKNYTESLSAVQWIHETNLLARVINDANVKRGFWKDGENRNKGEAIALMHSELSEALEGLRTKIPDPAQCPECHGISNLKKTASGTWSCDNGHFYSFHPATASDHIPEFSLPEEEFADCIVRILDFAHFFKLRVAETLIAKIDFNERRPFQHGKQF